MLSEEDLPESWVAAHEEEEYDVMQGREYEFELYDHRETGTAVRVNEVEGHKISGQHAFSGWGYQVLVEYGPRDDRKGEDELAVVEDLDEAHETALEYMQEYQG